MSRWQPRKYIPLRRHLGLPPVPLVEIAPVMGQSEREAAERERRSAMGRTVLFSAARLIVGFH
jgi:hypothetical protein